MHSSPVLLRTILLFALLANVYVLVKKLVRIQGFRNQSKYDMYSDYTDLRYSYQENDFPLSLPLDVYGTVAMSLQGSTRLQLNVSDPVAEEEWLAMEAAVKGYGRLRLGPERRMFLITWDHQLHCLWEIHAGLLEHDHKEANPHHLEHCFTYLRQTLLCDANNSLEEGDFMEMDYSQPNYVGSTLECHDWEKAHEALASNFDDFNQWGNSWL